MIEAIRKGQKRLLKKSSSTGSQINSLDGLRGVAVLFVILSHLSNRNMHVLPFLSFAGIGRVGVWLFFVLSSFLLTLQFLNCNPSSLRSSSPWINYFMRRFLRIYPLYTVVLVFMFLFPSKYFFGITAGDLLSHLTLQAGKKVFWTIPVEFKYYLLLPLVTALYIFVLRRNAAAVATLTAMAVVGLNQFELKLRPVSVVPYLPIFLLGSLAAFTHWKLNKREEPFSQGFRLRFEGCAIFIFVLITVLTPSIFGILVGREIPLDYFHRDFTLFGILWSVFVVAYLNGAGFLRRLLESPAMRLVGIVSFSGYLWHVPLIELVKDQIRAPHTLQAMIALTLILSVSVVSYLLIERRFMKIRFRKAN